jgi:L-alanine-DL-glutamate epimerase-like enolase superfamily enzyme
MKLDKIEIQILEFPPYARYKDGIIPPGRPLTWQFPLITMYTDNGLVGHTMIYGPQGDGPGMADILLKTYWPEIAGKDPRDTEVIWKCLMRKQRDLYNLSHTLTGVVDVALWDIKAKAEGVPVYKLLGEVRNKMPCYASCRSVDHSPEEFAEEALNLKEQGFHGYKIQVFGGDPEWDAECLRKTREVVGEDYPVMIDPNSKLSLEGALKFGKSADEYKAYWLEEPCDESDLFAYKRLTRELETPILAGETLSLQAMKNYFHEEAMDLVRGDVLIKGGITGLRKLTDTCLENGYKLEIHTTNTPILDLANFHVACSVGETTFIENHHPIFRFALENNPMDIDSEGWIHIPDKPGLGIELDHDWIKAHTTDVMTSHTASRGRDCPT